MSLSPASPCAFRSQSFLPGQTQEDEGSGRFFHIQARRTLLVLATSGPSRESPDHFTLANIPSLDIRCRGSYRSAPARRFVVLTKLSLAFLSFGFTSRLSFYSTANTFDTAP